MERKWLAALLPLTMMGAVSLAANPFADVTPDDWAYQAVSELSEEGVVSGYPDGMFRGERNVTRYEIAQITARLLAKEDQLSDRDRRMTEKLAEEYGGELSSLGVRVRNLEKQQGNISWSGDYRLRFFDLLEGVADPEKDIHHRAGDMSSYEDARLRISSKAEVAPKVTVNGRMTTLMSFGETGDEDVKFDRANVRWQMEKNSAITAGRQGIRLDQAGFFWDLDAAYDGLTFETGTDSFSLQAGIGYPQSVHAMWGQYFYGGKSEMESWYARIAGRAANGSELSAFYWKDTGTMKGILAPSEGLKASMYGAGADIHLGGKWDAVGDYIVTHFNHEGFGRKNAAYRMAGLRWGREIDGVPGSKTISLSYIAADSGSYLFGVTALDETDVLDYGLMNGMDTRFWSAYAGYVLTKNTKAGLFYHFGGKASGGRQKYTPGPKDTWGFKIDIKF